MKKILFVSCNDWMPWGGSEELWSKTALKISQKGFKVLVSVKDWQPAPAGIQNMEKEGVEITRRGNYRYSVPQRITAKLGITDLKNKYDILKEKPDIAVINQGDIFDGIDWAAQCSLYKVPYVIIAQLVNNLRFLTDKHLNEVSTFFTGALKTFFVSGSNHRLFEGMTGIRLSNAAVIQNPHKEVHSLPFYPSYENGYHLAFVAYFNSFHKGHDILFEVLDQPKWKQRDLHIHLYGKGPNEQYLKRLKDLKGLQNVYFEGHKDIRDIWNSNHGLILCSRMEGQSLALIEAMYCNRMAIVTKVGDANLLVEDGATGYLAKYPLPEFVDNALGKAWQNRELWRDMGCTAGKKIKKII